MSDVLVTVRVLDEPANRCYRVRDTGVPFHKVPMPDCGEQYRRAGGLHVFCDGAHLDHMEGWADFLRFLMIRRCCVINVEEV